MTGSFFNSLDYFYIFLTLISCLVGFFRGFIKDFFSTCSWLGSGFASAFVSPYLAHHLQAGRIISNPTFAKVAAIVISFTIVLITLQLTVNVISKSVKSTMLSGLDRAFGALYGFVRGFVVLIIICICAIMFDFVDFKRGFIASSKITPMLISVADYLMPKIVSVPKIENKVAPSRTDDHGFTEEDLREMEKFSRGKTRKIRGDQHKQADTWKTEEETGSFLSNFISRFFGKDDAQENPHSVETVRPTKPSNKRLKVKNKDDNVRFGCMDLIKARAKRKAQKKAERIKKDLIKRLDKKPR